MSNIPKARGILRALLADPSTPAITRRALRAALRLMTRVKYARRAPSKRQVIDKSLRRRIRYIAHDNPTMTEHEIANAVGLRSSGRISEVLHGKR